VSAPVRPTLLNACASAATAAEARFRIDRPISGGSTRVIAMDEGAAEVVRRVAEEPWGGARFLTSGTEAPAGGANGASADLVLRDLDGSGSRLSDELAEADVAIMIATSDHGAEAAAAIARACAERGITTAALILGDTPELGPAVSALRPYARILMATADEDDVSEVLTALRA
jgi:hypothetical protein